MKPAFNITPTSTGNKPIHLLIEAGSYGMHLIWFTKEAFSVMGLAVYNFTGNDTENDIKEILNLHEGFFKALASVTACYDFKESLLVPAKYNLADGYKEVLALVYGENDDSYFNSDLITSADIYNHYRVPAAIESVLSKRFPAAAMFHSSSLQVEELNKENELLYCIFFHNILKIILFKGGKLQVVRQYSYVAPEDVTYYLINVCEQHSVKPAEVQLRLSGMIDEESRLYNELYKYFLHLEFEKPADDMSTPVELKEFPPHFFSHLTALASCVS
ncbi:MAG: DUF3822 family protein [Ferruginibacter sp.]|nr:DUF3822 family protein [Ferruginibacter sp.]